MLMLRRSIFVRALSFSSSSTAVPIGFIGLGQMGSKMVKNFREDGFKLRVYDANKSAMLAIQNGDDIVQENTIQDIVENCTTVLSMLPNDKILMDVSLKMLEHVKPGHVHVSCSTVSPSTSRQLESLFNKKQATYIACPVFARPDGIAKRQATWLVSGNAQGRHLATFLLNKLGTVVDYGDDVGAANVVKLCGNFMIATSIESIAETMAFAEKHGVDRKAVMELLSSTIFDCIIFKGYGDRVSKRDHRPGGFSLELGYKDVSLVQQAAKDAKVPMPYLSILVDRFTSASAKGRGGFDWSAIGLNASEDAGIDVTADLKKNEDDLRTGNAY